MAAKAAAGGGRRRRPRAAPYLQRHVHAQRLGGKQRQKALAQRLVLRAVHKSQVLWPKDPLTRWVDGLRCGRLGVSSARRAPRTRAPTQPGSRASRSGGCDRRPGFNRTRRSGGRWARNCRRLRRGPAAGLPPPAVTRQAGYKRRRTMRSASGPLFISMRRDTSVSVEKNTVLPSRKNLEMPDGDSARCFSQ